MSTFWNFASVLLAITVLLMVIPLLRRPRDDAATDANHISIELFNRQLAELDADLATGKLDADQHIQAKQDLERALLHDMTSTPTHHNTRSPVLALALALIVPGLAVLLYGWLGNAPLLERFAATESAAAPPAATMPPLDELVARLAARLESNPDDLDGWMMLGRTYFAINQPQRALDALAHAYALAPDNPDVILGYAEAIVANNDHQFNSEAAKLIRQALELEPEHPGARWLGGVMAFQRGQFNMAIASWTHLLEQLDPASEDAQGIRELIEEAKQRASGAANETPQTTPDGIP